MSPSTGRRPRVICPACGRDVAVRTLYTHHGPDDAEACSITEALVGEHLRQGGTHPGRTPVGCPGSLQVVPMASTWRPDE